MRRAGWLIAAGAALAALSGCASFDDLDITYRSAPPPGADISFSEIHIPVGTAVGFIARPLDGGREMDENTEVDLESKNPAVLGVAPGQPNEFEESRDDKENWTFVIWGVSEGTTEVKVRIDGELEAAIPAHVDPQ